MSQKYIVYTGMFETYNKKQMVGVKILVESKDKKLYEIIYAGIGNYSDIKVEASMIINISVRKL